MGLLGAALLYGDGIITPAISVLSALEGVNVATDRSSRLSYRWPALFCCAFQHRWHRENRPFLRARDAALVHYDCHTRAAGIVRQPRVLVAIDPSTLALPGAIGLVRLYRPRWYLSRVTGGEALYADMGHIGRNPIRSTWYLIVLPALLLSYSGQTAFLLDIRALTAIHSSDSHPTGVSTRW